jgi:AcrR family transcriptional regulator
MAPTPQIPEDSIVQKIVAAARRHFLQHGFRGVTMDDLAVEMGMSKKTLYVHFRSKQDLLAAVIENKIGELEAQMDGLRCEGAADFADTLHRLLACMQAHAKEISPTFIRDLLRETPELAGVVKARRKKLIGRTFGRILQQGQAARSIRNDIPVDLLVGILLSTVEVVVTPEKVAEEGVMPGKLLANVLSVFLEGVLTEKGRLLL